MPTWNPHDCLIKWSIKKLGAQVGGTFTLPMLCKVSTHNHACNTKTFEQTCRSGMGHGMYLALPREERLLSTTRWLHFTQTSALTLKWFYFTGNYLKYIPTHLQTTDEASSWWSRRNSCMLHGHTWWSQHLAGGWVPSPCLPPSLDYSALPSHKWLPAQQTPTSLTTLTVSGALISCHWLKFCRINNCS